MSNDQPNPSSSAESDNDENKPTGPDVAPSHSNEEADVKSFTNQKDKEASSFKFNQANLDQIGNDLSKLHKAGRVRDSPPLVDQDEQKREEKGDTVLAISTFTSTKTKNMNEELASNRTRSVTVDPDKLSPDNVDKQKKTTIQTHKVTKSGFGAGGSSEQESQRSPVPGEDPSDLHSNGKVFETVPLNSETYSSSSSEKTSSNSGNIPEANDQRETNAIEKSTADLIAYSTKNSRSTEDQVKWKPFVRESVHNLSSKTVSIRNNSYSEGDTNSLFVFTLSEEALGAKEAEFRSLAIGGVDMHDGHVNGRRRRDQNIAGNTSYLNSETASSSYEKRSSKSGNIHEVKNQLETDAFEESTTASSLARANGIGDDRLTTDPMKFAPLGKGSENIRGSKTISMRNSYQSEDDYNSLRVTTPSEKVLKGENFDDTRRRHMHIADCTSQSPKGSQQPWKSMFEYCKEKLILEQRKCQSKVVEDELSDNNVEEELEPFETLVVDKGDLKFSTILLILGTLDKDIYVMASPGECLVIGRSGAIATVKRLMRASGLNVNCVRKGNESCRTLEGPNIDIANNTVETPSDTKARNRSTATFAETSGSKGSGGSSDDTEKGSKIRFRMRKSKLSDIESACNVKITLVDQDTYIINGESDEDKKRARSKIRNYYSASGEVGLVVVPKFIYRSAGKDFDKYGKSSDGYRELSNDVNSKGTGKEDYLETNDNGINNDGATGNFERKDKRDEIVAKTDASKSGYDTAQHQLILDSTVYEYIMAMRKKEVENMKSELGASVTVISQDRNTTVISVRAKDAASCQSFLKLFHNLHSRLVLDIIAEEVKYPKDVDVSGYVKGISSSYPDVMCYSRTPGIATLIATDKTAASSALQQLKIKLGLASKQTRELWKTQLSQHGDLVNPTGISQPGSHTSSLQDDNSVHQTAVPTTTKGGGLCVEVMEGDITKLDVDVIVSPSAMLVSGSISLSCGVGVAKAISKASGWRLEKVCEDYNLARIRTRSNTKTHISDVVVTPSVGLKCQQIFHVVSPQYSSRAEPLFQLKDTIVNCLREAKSFNSIAFPAIGGGQIRLPLSDIAKTFHQAVKEFDSSQGSSNSQLKRVVLVDINKKMVEEWRKVFNCDVNGVSQGTAFSFDKDENKQPYSIISAITNPFSGLIESGRQTVSYFLKTSDSSSSGKQGSSQFYDQNGNPLQSNYQSQVVNHTGGAAGAWGQNPDNSNLAQRQGGTDDFKVGIANYYSGTSNTDNDFSHAGLPLSYAGVVAGTTSSVSNNASAADVASGSKSSDSSQTQYSQQKSPDKSFDVDKKTSVDDPSKDNCVICMCPLGPLYPCEKLQKCGHVFHKDCIDDCFKQTKPQCPICGVIYGQITGIQPTDGRMRVNILNGGLPGYETYKTIEISYSFPDGIQTNEHPNPRRRYRGCSRTAYLPETEEGKKVLSLLQRSFDARLTFTVGKSVTLGTEEDRVTWNDIHHKTSQYGGTANFGYPDAGYLKRVQEELKAKGIK